MIIEIVLEGRGAYKTREVTVGRSQVDNVPEFVRSIEVGLARLRPL